jgi:hypothetical protein
MYFINLRFDAEEYSETLCKIELNNESCIDFLAVTFTSKSGAQEELIENTWVKNLVTQSLYCTWAETDSGEYFSNLASARPLVSW